MGPRVVMDRRLVIAAMRRAADEIRFWRDGRVRDGCVVRDGRPDLSTLDRTARADMRRMDRIVGALGQAIAAVRSDGVAARRRPRP